MPPTSGVGKAAQRDGDRTAWYGIDATFLRLLCTGVAVVLGGSFHFGYQISLINPLADVLQEFLANGLKQSSGVAAALIADDSALRDALWGSVAGILFAGALLGAVGAPTLLENFGAKRSLLISSALLCASFSLAAGAKFLFSPLAFILARFLSGVGIGLVTTVQTVYLTEISPVKHRGLMGTLTGFATSVGFVAASGVGLPQALGSAHHWHWAYVLEMLPSLLLVVTMFTVLAESPVYSMRRGRENDALRCIRLYHATEAEQQTRLSEIRRELYGVSLPPVDDDDDVVAPPLTSCACAPPNGEKAQLRRRESATFLRIIASRSSRNALVICMLLNATVSFSGILAVSFFGTFLLQGIGFSESGAALANCLASFSGILGNVAGSFAIDRVGRRKLVIGGLCTLAALNTVLMLLAFAFQLTANVTLGYGFLAVFMLFLFAFSCGVGPMAWFLATELSTSANRSRVQSAAVACQYATCFLSPLLFFPLYQNCGALSFLVFIAPLSFTGAYLFLYLPETRNRSTVQIVADLRLLQSGAQRSKRKSSAAIYAVSAIRLPQQQQQQQRQQQQLQLPQQTKGEEKKRRQFQINY